MGLGSESGEWFLSAKLKKGVLQEERTVSLRRFLVLIGKYSKNLIHCVMK
jgi:hypothetical protein